MSTVDEVQAPRERTGMYIAIGISVVLLMVLGLLLFRGAEQTREAEEKADQLIGLLEAAGANAPSQEMIVRVLGEDGGAVCANPNESLSRAILFSQLANGAAGPGSRPGIVDSRVVRGQLLIIQVYCPDELDEFREFVDSLTTADLIR